MAEENIIEDVEHIELSPSEGENVEEPTEETPEGAEGAESKEERLPKEQLIINNAPVAPVQVDPNVAGEANPVEGESPRERALRQKMERVEAENRKLRGGELGIGNETPKPQAKKELSAEKQAILAKYKPQEIDSLKEVLPVIAEDLGFVRADQLTQQQYNERAEQELDTFLKEHPAYLPENDKDNVLWSRLKEEFAMYKPPQNPKDYRKILNRVHTDIFGIQPVGDKGAINAAQRKIQVASHAGTSGPSTPASTARSRPGAGLRLDMLKGFSEEEKAEFAGQGD